MYTYAIYHIACMYVYTMLMEICVESRGHNCDSLATFQLQLILSRDDDHYACFILRACGRLANIHARLLLYLY